MFPRNVVRGTCVAGLILSATIPAATQERFHTFSIGQHQPSSDVRAADTAVLRMLDAGTLRTSSSERDSMMSDRLHERFQQLHRGVPVWGGDLTRQSDRGVPVSVFGRVYDNVSIDVTPRLSSEAARAAIERLAGASTGRTPELLVLPRPGGTYRLTWSLNVLNSQMRNVKYFVDAHTGDLVHSLDVTTTQAAVGVGRGVLNDSKKVSTEAAAGAFRTVDRLRPLAIQTYDMRGDLNASLEVLNGNREFFTSELAADSDNDWQDGAVVDAHVYTSRTYDFYFKRFNRFGLNGDNSTVLSVVHPVRRTDLLRHPDWVIGTFFLNAFYMHPDVMVYGEGLPAGYTAGGKRVNYFSGSLDIVAHELTHGVTAYSSDLLYEGEAGALNEAFSDIMATAVEFFFQETGSGLMRADYLIGEDVLTPGGIRSMENPASVGDPDHYSRRYTGSEDNGGVHINSGIPNHAFYLAIEGGTNRTSGLAVQGVGGANREQIEKAFYRAFVFMLPSTANFAMARTATIQAARDLYGSGSAAERAITEAWTAVGVN